MEKFEFELSNGKICAIEIEYKCEMEYTKLDADGIAVEGKKEPSSTGNMIIYIDNQKFDDCWNPAFWDLEEININGTKMKKIRGTKVCFVENDVAQKYSEWLKNVINSGKSSEVKAWEKKEKEKQNKNRLERAKRIIAKAESQADIPSRKEAKERMKQYNDIVNEGGEGIVPYIISLEEYEYAKEIIKKFEKGEK